MTVSSIARRVTLAATGVVLATTLVAAPVLAASPSPATPGLDLGLDRCSAARITARANPTVENVKAVGDCEIARRLETVKNLQAVVADSGTLTSAHKDALNGILSSTASGLTSLKATIDGDTTLGQLTTDLRRIVTDERVYLVVARQVFLVRAADTGSTVAADMGDATTSLQTAIDEAKANGKDTSAAEAALASMQGHLSDATGKLDGVAADVLAVTPASFDAGTGGPALRTARADLGAARQSLRAALADARTVLADLR